MNTSCDKHESTFIITIVTCQYLLMQQINYCTRPNKKIFFACSLGISTAAMRLCHCKNNLKETTTTKLAHSLMWFYRPGNTEEKARLLTSAENLRQYLCTNCSVSKA
jgi:hypothetical protein